MEPLKGSQKKYLRGLAHSLNPSAFVGQKGITSALTKEIDAALDAGELIKVRFVDFKLKAQKQELIDKIARATSSHVAGMIGHVAILYRPHKDSEKRNIRLPE